MADMRVTPEVLAEAVVVLDTFADVGPPRILRSSCGSSTVVNIMHHVAILTREPGTYCAASVSPFLEREVLRSMIGEHDMLEADASGDFELADAACVAPAAGGLLRLVAVNVDDSGEYDAPPSGQMEAILKEVLAVSPDVWLLQEVVHEMQEVFCFLLMPWIGQGEQAPTFSE